MYLLNFCSNFLIQVHITNVHVACWLSLIVLLRDVGILELFTSLRWKRKLSWGEFWQPLSVSHRLIGSYSDVICFCGAKGGHTGWFLVSFFFFSFSLFPSVSEFLSTSSSSRFPLISIFALIFIPWSHTYFIDEKWHQPQILLGRTSLWNLRKGICIYKKVVI